MADRMFEKVINFVVEELPPYLHAKGKKSLRQQFLEMSRIYKRYHALPYHYVKHSLYLKSFDGDLYSYLPAKMMERFIQESNPAGHIPLALNKRLFSEKMHKAGLPVVRDLFVIDGDGKIVSASEQLTSYDQFAMEISRARNSLFFKPTFGAVGEGARMMSPDEVLDLGHAKLIELLFKEFPETLERSYLVQDAIVQHPTLSRLTAQSVNTVRIDTYWDEEKILSNSAVLRVGNGISRTDNWGGGGLIVKVDFETGKLVGLGKRKAKFGKQDFARHPVTGVTFDGLQLPYWADVKDLVQRAAVELLPLRCIGWDIAVTGDGPVLVEANDKYEIFLSQEACGGYRDTPVGRAILHRFGC